ncbi:helix-turn-helix transcriptional regulator [Amycolatopsis acidiphila]|uniref:Helix-turn-helix domain-containing protein n=1 Tax=Amycolatopsis acidiphila TaxID=715473 RepID=A0A558AFR7_9PSEU|nr:helix-turn-helix transcriptional regulator [Amycolatopsis acidiphila]TVT23115.1 helix-turn-helix domain-containing protein [Amycolatopsis acidiphila]UIJ60199.1 helix-turn-helix transcriptional regulator [Amycolatopsis acidiphila]GHG60825.1 transcriptional regulator [Amycolatopsis acidiphila]
MCDSGGITTAVRPSADVVRRRERIAPEQLGLPGRRTPGLRREEVAQLAGVGVTWYTWLEQGRDINASEQVLQAIANTLGFDPYERAHLFTLAGVPEPVSEQECKAVTPEIHAMLEKLEPYPAAVYNARTDILAYNRAFNWLLDIDRLPFEERNSVLQCFTNPEWRTRLKDWDDSVPRAVAQLRAMMAEHVSEPAWKQLVKRLRRESPEFDALWNRHEVQPMRNLTKRIVRPQAGLLSFNYTHLWFGRHSETRMTTHVPADEETERKLRRYWS